MTSALKVVAVLARIGLTATVCRGLGAHQSEEEQ